MRRILVGALGLALLAGCGTEGTAPPTTATPLPELRIGTVPSAPLAVPLVGLDADPAVTAQAATVRLVPANGPDEIRANLTSGAVDVATMPTQIAANLANGGLDVELVGVVSADLLKVIGPAAGGWEALRGQTVHLPFRGDAADLIFGLLAERNGLVPGRDLTVAYATSLPELVSGVTTGTVTHAVLPEQFATIARTSRPGTVEMFGLQEQWRQATGATALPSSAIVVRGTVADERPELVAALRAHFRDTTSAVLADPAGYADRVAALSGMPPALVPTLLPRLEVGFTEPAAARPDVETMLRLLTEREPRSTGGSVPGDAFFGG